ncbi:MAG: hypothetical protein IPN09_09100 [Bacteroidetes bacterium]|nr:hypothetical protein [Bacteroidota bacterium]
MNWSVKLTGAGFPVYKGKVLILQRALISFFLDEAGKAGYNEVIPPLMVNEEKCLCYWSTTRQRGANVSRNRG